VDLRAAFEALVLSARTSGFSTHDCAARAAVAAAATTIARITIASIACGKVKVLSLSLNIQDWAAPMAVAVGRASPQ
jgi:hypothetical protein